jgi:hypothetical protein
LTNAKSDNDDSGSDSDSDSGSGTISVGLIGTSSRMDCASPLKAGDETNEVDDMEE